MNKMKKFASIATAVLMTACMAAPMTMSFTSSATTVTLNAPTNLPAGSSISDITAFQVFVGEYTPAVEADETANPKVEAQDAKLTVTDWGNGINIEAFITALKADDIFKTVDEEVPPSDPDAEPTIQKVNAFNNITYDSSEAAKSAQAVADIISKWDDDSDLAKEFARVAVLNKTGTGTAGTLGTEETTKDKVTFGETNLADGYYVVTCKVSNTDAATHTANSLGMLTVLGGTAEDLDIGSTGIAKVGLPTVMKKVQENVKEANAVAEIGSFKETDKKWNDVADYCIGDAVPFKLYGTMPDDLDKYKAYYYEFTDTLGTEFNMPETIKITIEGKTLTATKGASDNTYTLDDTSDKNCRVKVTGQKISISFENIRAYTGVDKDTLVTVEYDAVLNDTAKIGLPGQTNKVDLTYSNDANVNYKPDTTNDEEDKPGDDDKGKTPEDTVIVFTYEADFTKIDGVTKDPLAGVEFQLKNGDGKYAVVKEGKFVRWSDTTVEEGTDGLTTLTSADSDGTFKIIGLDAGEYTLHEKTPLEGYNPINDITVIITGETANSQTWAPKSDTEYKGAEDALTKFSYKIGNADQVDQTGTVVDESNNVTDPITGIAIGTIENKKGATVPETGGIGTKLFYLGGGAMVAVAGVFLITKKRMSKEEN